MSPKAKAATSLHASLVGTLEALPDKGKEPLITALAQWTYAHLADFGPSRQVYGLDALSSLDVSRFPVAIADFDASVALKRLREVPPSSVDSLAMRIRDLLWDALVLQTARRCPRCGQDNLRLLKVAGSEGGVAYVSDFCGYAESDVAGWRDGQALEPMTTEEIAEHGLLPGGPLARR